MRVLVPDTDVLIALSCAKGDFVDLFSEVFHDHLIVTATVADELRDVVSRKADLRCASYVLGQVWVGAGLAEDEDDLHAIYDIRDRIARPDDPDRMHMGEASVLFRTSQDPGHVAVLSDRDAREYAATNNIPYTTVDGLLQTFVQRGLVDCIDAHTGFMQARKVSKLPLMAASDFCRNGCPTHQPST